MPGSGVSHVYIILSTITVSETKVKSTMQSNPMQHLHQNQFLNLFYQLLKELKKFVTLLAHLKNNLIGTLTWTLQLIYAFNFRNMT